MRAALADRKRLAGAGPPADRKRLAGGRKCGTASGLSSSHSSSSYSSTPPVPLGEVGLREISVLEGEACLCCDILAPSGPRVGQPDPPTRGWETSCGTSGVMVRPVAG